MGQHLQRHVRSRYAVVKTFECISSSAFASSHLFRAPNVPAQFSKGVLACSSDLRLLKL